MAPAVSHMATSNPPLTFSCLTPPAAGGNSPGERAVERTCELLHNIAPRSLLWGAALGYPGEGPPAPSASALPPAIPPSASSIRAEGALDEEYAQEASGLGGLLI